MGIYTYLFILGLSIYTGYVCFTIFSDDGIPELPDYYWGPKSKQGQKEDESIRPFKINVDEKVLSDLKTRLKYELSTEGSRIVPSFEQAKGFQYGFNTKYLKKVSQYWLDKYDWRQREKILNKYPQFKTKIAGLDIHFLHIKGNNNKKYNVTRPILLAHGFPGGYLELLKIIPLLTDPVEKEINFEVVIPSAPGFGLSEASHKPGLGSVEVAQIYMKLMLRLGYNRFYAHGDGCGGTIVTHMASLYHKVVMGMHSTSCISVHPRAFVRQVIVSLLPHLFVDSNDVSKYSPISNYVGNVLGETGYMHIQATKPDTIGIGISQSPSALLVYILEKYSSWTNSNNINKEDGGLGQFNLDELLDNVMLYWTTNSFVSAIRVYADTINAKTRGFGLNRLPTYVPTSCMNMANDLFTQPEFVLGDKYPQIIKFKKAERGGHFASFEEPQLVANNVIAFFTHMENSGLALFHRRL